VLKKALIIITIFLTASIVFAQSSSKIAKDVDQLIKDGNLTAAEAMVDSALINAPEDYKLLRAKGKILFEKEDFPQALEYFENTLLQKKKDHEALYGAGMSALKTNQSQKALDYFERGIKTKKLKNEFLYGKAIALMNLGELSEADVVIRKAIKNDKENPTYQRAWGDINYAKEVWTFAITAYKNTLELDSSQTDLLYKLAKANLYSRNVNEAANYYKEYIKIHDADTTAWRELELIYEKSNNPSEAVFCCNKLTDLKPNDGDNWYKLGDLQFSLHNYEEAGIALEKAVELGANVAESYKRLAKIYQLRKEYFKADSAYTRFENELGAPDDPVYWFNKGKVMIKVGQKDAAFFDKASKAFDKAIELDSTEASYWEYSGLARYYKQDYASAIPFFQKRIELGSESVNSLRNLAFCFLKTEKYKLAASTLEEAIALKPEDAVMRQMIGKIYVFLHGQSGDTLYTLKAIKHYKVALTDTTGSLKPTEKCKVRGDLGYCYVVLRESKKAISMLETAIKCDPKNIDYLYNLASSYHLDNQFDLANKYYKEVLKIDPNHMGAKEGKARTTKVGG